ncbi:hypothetical protein AYO40_03945 [Planctomycetaceae bacterium SCGC AG-212-D15]|nr:hypothetical protein AYO40_03945 [Planctomycetaceae bacterium SCGC AG-212-D15]
MAEIVSCPSCQRQLRVPEQLLNQRVKCPSCGTLFDASSPAPPEPATVASVPPPPPPPPPEPAPVVLQEVVPPLPRLGTTAERPGKVQAIGIMTLIGGILAVLNFLFWSLGSGFACCLWPGVYYSLVLGIMAIIKGSALIGSNAHLETPPQAIAIMQIINIINVDVPNCVMGILTLVFLNEAEVQAFFRKR